MRHGGLHVAGVESAGDLQGDDAAAGDRVVLEGVESVECTGDDDLSAAVEVRRFQSELLEPGEQVGLVAAQYGGHAGRGLRGRGGHGRTALANESDGIRLAQDSGRCCGCHLADRVSGDAGDLRAAAVGEQGAEGEESGRDDERLGDRGVADRVGVARGAVRGEVDARGVGEAVELFPEPRLSEPGGEETGSLGALSGRNNNNHAL
jgi:hypothetical protein